MESALVTMVSSWFPSPEALLGWLLFGLLIGILSAMLGIGGGTVMVPVFRLVGGFSAVASSATSLFVIVPTGISGVWRHLKAGTCCVPIGLAAGLAGACTSVLGAKLADGAPGWTIMAVAVLVVAYSAYTMLRKALSPAPAAKAAAAAEAARSTAVQEGMPAANAAAAAEAAREAVAQEGMPAANAAPAAEAAAPAAASAPVPAPSSASASSSVPTKVVVLAALVGLLTGVLSGFVGVGGGFIMVPLFCSWLKMDMRHAAGTSLLAVFCLSLPAAVAQIVMGNVMIAVGCAVALGSIVGAVFGQKISAGMSDRALRLAFGALLLFAAVMMVINELGLVG